jgi:hypothetical protein
MEMVTLHELSVMFDVTVRVLRSRVRQLVQAGKLIEGQDCLREGYVDQTHFVWKISPSAFMRVTGLRLVDQSVTPRSTMATESVGEVKVAVTPTPPGGDKTSINLDTKPSGMEREMIELLKGQLVVKDGQIADLTLQNKTVVALNEKLTGAVVHHTEQIKKLLQLTGGRTEPEPVVSEPVAQRATTGSTTDTQAATDDGNKAA